MIYKWIYENFIFIYDFQQPEIRQEETGIMWMASTADLLFPQVGEPVFQLVTLLGNGLFKYRTPEQAERDYYSDHAD